MRLLLKNPFKRTDVFTCNYLGHDRFENKVSAYHVLQAKQCYPQGCIYFRWSCSKMIKGERCKRGYNFVGRLCQGCTYYHDEKQHCQPSLCLSEQEYQLFLSDVEAFTEWVDEMGRREVAVAFTIDAVKPRFIKEIGHDRGRVRLSGYLLIMKQGFIDRTFFEDHLYCSISPGQQEQHHFAPDDQVEGRATLRLDRGRLVLSSLRGVFFEARSGRPTWSNSQALVARSGASHFNQQTSGCMQCPQGALVDVTETEGGLSRQHRELYCLAGMPDQRECYLHALHKIDMCHHL
jgi:hypothetical protein